MADEQPTPEVIIAGVPCVLARDEGHVTITKNMVMDDENRQEIRQLIVDLVAKHLEMTLPSDLLDDVVAVIEKVVH